MIDFKVCVCVCVSYSGFPLAWHVSSRFSPSLVRPWGNSTTIFTSGLSERIKERELFNGTAGKTRIGLSSLLVWSRHRASSDSCHGCTIQERGSRISWFKEIHEMHVQRRTGLVNRFHLAPGFPNMAPTQPRRSCKNPRVENCFPGCFLTLVDWQHQLLLRLPANSTHPRLFIQHIYFHCLHTLLLSWYAHISSIRCPVLLLQTFSVWFHRIASVSIWTVGCSVLSGRFFLHVYSLQVSSAGSITLV